VPPTGGGVCGGQLGCWQCELPCTRGALLILSLFAWRTVKTPLFAWRTIDVTIVGRNPLPPQKSMASGLSEAETVRRTASKPAGTMHANLYVLSISTTVNPIHRPPPARLGERLSQRNRPPKRLQPAQRRSRPPSPLPPWLPRAPSPSPSAVRVKSTDAASARSGRGRPPSTRSTVRAFSCTHER